MARLRGVDWLWRIGRSDSTAPAAVGANVCTTGTITGMVTIIFPSHAFLFTDHPFWPGRLHIHIQDLDRLDELIIRKSGKKPTFMSYPPAVKHAGLNTEPPVAEAYLWFPMA